MQLTLKYRLTLPLPLLAGQFPQANVQNDPREMGSSGGQLFEDNREVYTEKTKVNTPFTRINSVLMEVRLIKNQAC